MKLNTFINQYVTARMGRCHKVRKCFSIRNTLGVL